ncbi:translation initiation factor IF-2 N-terminal domain-containing protein [Corynebacterium ammoniagenes]|uniref:Ribonuclease E n=1 Tax=Corynebacterium ammoniagenes TaxID=1697 RepID=A0AAV5G8B4_CORAM|nr:translation initiation factor IF-2 N-terminal domain-containing protein [Corynebacterium ammoniagenes]GJN43556.1 hypothetical protein CAT723_20350 [Corynebacterium ammoniagenes]
MATADEQLNEQLAGAAALAGQIDRKQLGERVRVYTLAKQLGISSKLLIAQLQTQGISKKAQSALTAEEIKRLFDSLQASNPAPVADVEDSAPTEAAEAPKTAAKKTAKKPAKKTAKASKKSTSKRATKAAAPADVEPAQDQKQSKADDAAADDQPAEGEQSSSEAPVTPAAEETPGKKTRKRAVRKSTRAASKKSTPRVEDEQAAGAKSEPAAAEVGAEVEEAVAHAEKTEPANTSDTPDTPDTAEPSSHEEASQEEALQTPTRKRSRTRRVVKRTGGAPEATASEEPAQPQGDTTDATDAECANGDDGSDKLRYRVQKNVENEIQQIEGKVESELAAAALEALAEKQHEDSDSQDIDIDDSFVESLLTPPEKPKAEDDDILAAYAPIFMPPKPVKAAQAPATSGEGEDSEQSHDDHDDESHESSSRRRRGRRGTSRGRGKEAPAQAEQEKKNEVEIIDEPRGIKGSTRIESQRRRRAEMRTKDRESRHVVTQAEFLARREAVERTMVVRERERHDGHGNITQVGVLEDGMLVEHFVTDETNTSIIGNIYLGRVQNVLPSMEAAFIDIGTGRNGVLYAGEVNWRQAGLGGRARKIEQAMKSGDQVLVQVAKDPVGHKGPRLTTQVSLPGRFLVYVPGGRNAGISRKLPAPERKRLREILEKVVPEQGGAIIRTAAENVAEEAIAADVNRLHDTWNEIKEAAEKEKASKGTEPVALYEEPQMLVKVVRDLFNEDFDRLVVDGKRPYEVVSSYVNRLAPELADRVSRYNRADNGGIDAFETYRIDEQLHKALSRKVWLPSGGTLVIDRTEAMTVVDVNTGKFTGTGGNLEETVTKNNLEAAEEIVRQMRLRDLGGMIVVDFIDMVLPENQELVLRRLKEALGRDRTRHQVSEVTSLGLVQMTRKRLGSGLLEIFSTECEVCQGRGLILHEDPVEEDPSEAHDHRHDARDDKRRSAKKHRDHTRQDKHAHKDESEEAHDEQASDEDKQTPTESGGRRKARRSSSQRRSQDSRRHDSSRHDARRSDKRSDDSSLEDLIAGIVVDSSQVEEEAQRDTKSDNSVTDIESIAYAASDRAESLDDVGEFSTYVSEDSADADTGGRSYEQALKEYEQSPRRKRKTRGNSRSDYPPRREDFASSEDRGTTQRDTSQSDASQGGSAADGGMEIHKDTKRRRVRARNRKPVVAQQQSAAQAESASEKAQHESEQKPGSSRGEQKRAQVQAVTRGRRRAVRRTSQPRNAGHNSAPKENTVSAQSRPDDGSGVEVQRKRTDSGVEVTTVRRGRKRAVRRVAVREDGQRSPQASQASATGGKPAKRSNNAQSSQSANAQGSKAQSRNGKQRSSQQRSAQGGSNSGAKNSGGRTRRRVSRRGNN